FFPVLLLRELQEKWLRHSRFLHNGTCSGRRISRNSLLNSLLAGNFAGDRRDHYCIASQARGTDWPSRPPGASRRNLLHGESVGAPGRTSAMTESDLNKLVRRADQALVILTLSIAALIVSVSLLLR